MDKDKSLYELGQEYDTYAEQIQAQIQACKKQPPSYENGKRLVMLQEAERDLKSNAELLKHYYENRSEKRAYHRNNAYFNKERK